MSTVNIPQLCREFLSTFDFEASDRIWVEQSNQFKTFWKDRILSDDLGEISDDDCDKIVRILDQKAKGNTSNSEAVAHAMVPQGAWRRMFNEFHNNKELSSLVFKIFNESNIVSKGKLIDQLYLENEGRRNNLTGPSGNAISALLAGYDPINNLSMISLNDRLKLINFLAEKLDFEWSNQDAWDNETIGHRIARSNQLLIDAFHDSGLKASARTITRFCYSPAMRSLWKDEHVVQLADKNIQVTIPTIADELNDDVNHVDEVRESIKIQALISKIGVSMGFSIWLPKGDRSRVLQEWEPEPGQLVDVLPLGYDSGTMKTIEQIDVIWLRKRSIVRAFEVEHTTSVYSGILRMADLVALQPNINIRLNIVAPITRRDKVFQEIQRPVFSLIEGRPPLPEFCAYLSYDNIKEIAALEHLPHLSEKVIQEYEETAETQS